MKRLILATLLALPVLVMANDLSVVCLDTFQTADTAADAAETDSFYTPVVDLRTMGLRGGSAAFYSYYVPEPGYSMFNTAEDTVYVYGQVSPDQLHWRTITIDSLDTDGDSGFASLQVIDTLGNWFRFMVTRFDSTDADIPDSVSLVRGARFTGWIIGGTK